MGIRPGADIQEGTTGAITVVDLEAMEEAEVVEGLEEGMVVEEEVVVVVGDVKLCVGLYLYEYEVDLGHV